MGKTLNLSALLIANQLDIKGIKSFLKIKPLADSSTELFYGFEHDRYQYYFNCGVVVFSGYTEEEIKQAIELIKPFEKSPIDKWSQENYEIALVPGGKIECDANRLSVDRLDDKVVRIASANFARFIALENYHGIIENLLTEVKGFTRNLENKGGLNAGRKNILKFLGKALNIQNEIADSIYVFDEPVPAFDDQYLNLLYRSLTERFDLSVRFNEIRYTIRIIEGNLDVFLGISNQRQSSTLEWVIIIMILVELIYMFALKLP